MWLWSIIGLGWSLENRVETEPPNPAFRIGVQALTVSSLGLTAGAAFAADNGWYLGAQYGLSRVRGNRLFGANTDLFYDGSMNNAIWTVGPKVGVLALGLDAGLAVQAMDDVQSGYYARSSLNLGLGSLYYRMIGWSDLGMMHQVGFSVQIPQLIGRNAAQKEF